MRYNGLFVRALVLSGALVVGAACTDDSSGDSSSTTPGTAAAETTESTIDAASASTSSSAMAPDTTEPGPTTSEPTPTLAQEIPDEELPQRLLDVFTDNFGDANFAFCVQQQVLQGLEAGAIAPVDIDNYVRNNITDPMRDLLLQIQNEGTCSG